MTERAKFTALVAALAAILVGVMASGAWSQPAKPKKVAGILTEFKIKLKPKTPKSGPSVFAVKNAGGIKHEFVVVHIAGPDAALPMKADGSVDESQIPETDKLGEVAGLKPKKSGTLKTDLAPGTYEIFCNIVTKQPGGTVLSHYAKGMHTQITVG